MRRDVRKTEILKSVDDDLRKRSAGLPKETSSIEKRSYDTHEEVRGSRFSDVHYDYSNMDRQKFSMLISGVTRALWFGCLVLQSMLFNRAGTPV